MTANCNCCACVAVSVAVCFCPGCGCLIAPFSAVLFNSPSYTALQEDMAEQQLKEAMVAYTL